MDYETLQQLVTITLTTQPTYQGSKILSEALKLDRKLIETLIIEWVGGSKKQENRIGETLTKKLLATISQDDNCTCKLKGEL